MTERQKEMLIEAVHNEPALWRMHDAVYKSTKQTVRNEMWMKIGLILNIDDVNMLKSMWRTLRDGFAREWKKVPVKSGCAAPDLYRGSWSYFQRLLFLRETIEGRPMTGNLTQQEQKKSGGTSTSNIVVVQTGSDASSMFNPTYGSESTSNENHLDVGGQHFSELMVDDAEDVDGDRDEQERDITTRLPETNTIGTSRKRTTGSRALDVEEKKVDAFCKKVDIQAARLQKEAEPEDADLLFLKSLLPDIQKAKKKRKLKRGIVEFIDDFLLTKELLCEPWSDSLQDA